MDQSAIEKIVLSSLYRAYFTDFAAVAKEALQAHTDSDPSALSRILGLMCDEGIIRVWTAGPTYRITTAGVQRTEDLSVGPTDLVTTNSSLRTSIMSRLAAAYDSQGTNGFVYQDELIRLTGSDPKLFAANAQVLLEFGYILSTGPAYRTTLSGYRAVEEWRRRSGLCDEYQRILKMQPQPRGRALQTLFARIAAEDGWSQEEGLRTRTEEIDVVLYKGDRFYLVECKWEKDPVGSADIGWLQTKLRKLAGTRGVFVSMSGFTETAALTARDATADSLIMFFGPGDVEAMIYNRLQITRFLEKKLQELVMRRKLVYK